MNLYGSHRKLLANSKHAIIAAIEIYNKPKFEYREEIFTILIATAWELFILAVLSKNKQRIFAPKKSHDEYRTLSFEEAMKQAGRYFPKDVNFATVSKNISLLRKYRNTAVHYYQKEQNKQLIYGLANASIIYYKDLLLSIFKDDITKEVNLALLPLSFSEPPDLVEFLGKASKSKKSFSPFEREFFDAMTGLNIDGIDRNRLVTQYTIKMVQVKNPKDADILVGKAKSGKATLVVSKNVNPDDSHPFRRMDIIGGSGKSRNKKLQRDIRPYEFQAVVWKHNIRNKSDYCWKSKVGNSSARYSFKMIDFLNGLTDDGIAEAKEKYREYWAKRRQKKG